MIELNLTYEESKKILELGYDFSKICDRFFIKYEGYRGDTEGYFFKMNDSSDMFPLDATISTYDEVWDHGISLEHEHEEVTPIIPKAALQKCLPARLSFGHSEYSYLKYDYYENEFQYYQYPDWYYDDGKICYSSKSVFEIFLWCHENYPEELKKKFDEVMA